MKTNTEGGAPASAGRLQVELPDSTYKQVIAVVKYLKTSRRNYVESALALFAWAIRESQEGREIGSVSADGTSFKQAVVPILEQLRHESGIQNKTKASAFN